MDLAQLKTFVTVAREGSITRASEQLHLSQPALSAHIKTIEEGLGIRLFERTARGMSLTHDGQRILAKAEGTLAAHQALMDEATRRRVDLIGKLRLGSASNSSHEAVGRLITALSKHWPGVEVVMKHGGSHEILTGLRGGNLDAGFYNEPDEPEPDLTTVRVAEFTICLVTAPGVGAAPGVAAAAGRPDWNVLAELPWIFPTGSACCSRTAENLFAAHRFRPRRIIGVDRQEVTRTLVAAGIGVGLLHADAAREARRRGEAEVVFEVEKPVRVLFAYLARRAEDPLVAAAASIMREPSRD